MTDDDGGVSPTWEVSPYNALARRVAGGIWNEDVLPVLEWEIAEHRVVVPKDLQRALGIDVPVLRWARTKRERVLSEHGYVLALIESPTSELARWIYAGPDPRKANEGEYAPFLVFTRRGEFWVKLVFGKTRAGDMNFVSAYGTTRERVIGRGKDSGNTQRWC